MTFFLLFVAALLSNPTSAIQRTKPTAFTGIRSIAQSHRSPIRFSGIASAETSADVEELLDVEDITTFATENGVTLSFKTIGPGYRGVASAKNDPEHILGYIEGFIRPRGKILHADKMEVFKNALNSARKETDDFRGGGSFLGPGLLIAYVCLLHGKESGCEECEFLAIDDADFQHKRLTRYYRTAGFKGVRYVGEDLKDLGDRLTWGGCGTLMTGNIDDILAKWSRIIRGSK